MGSNESGYVPSAPRVDFKTPIVFRFADGIAKGHSQNISESGILAVFDRTLDASLTGQLLAEFGEWHISRSDGYSRLSALIEARVVRVDGHRAALTFVNISDDNRAIIRKVIKDASAGLS